MTKTHYRLAVPILLAFFIIPLSTQAATWTVNSTADDGDGTCTVTKCTLRDAIATSTAGDTIVFAASLTSGGAATTTLTQGYMTIDHELTINGPGADLYAIDGNHTVNNGGIFYIDNASTTISGLTLTNANGYSSHYNAIWNAGSGNLTIINDIFSNNDGGQEYPALYDDSTGDLYISGSTFTDNFGSSNDGNVVSKDSTAGNVTIINSTFSRNYSSYAQDGQAVYMGNPNGLLTITNSNFDSNNDQNSGGKGGAIYTNAAATTITNSTFTNNSVTSSGGAIYQNSGDMTITGSTFTSNLASSSSGYGGAIYMSSSGSMTISNSTFTNNISSIDGGAIDQNAGDLEILNSTFNGNFASGNNGGYGAGAILAYGNSFSVASSTFINNVVNTDDYGIGGGQY
ncbi:MAG: CSLREA domain-containing protein [Patescibacteria group bacterium]|nr:CSLREA domain-containing protein [Patescibacteria group bacterium]